MSSLQSLAAVLCRHPLPRSSVVDKRSVTSGIADLGLTQLSTGPYGLRSHRHLPGVVCVYNEGRYCLASKE